MRLELPTHRLQSWLLNQLDDLLRDRQTDYNDNTNESMHVYKESEVFMSIILLHCCDFKLLDNVEVPKQYRVKYN